MSSTISRTDLHPMINELSSSTNTMHNQQNKPDIHDKPLSLILSLRIKDQFLLQNQTIDEHRSISSKLSTSDRKTSSRNQSKTIQTKSDLIEPPSKSISTAAETSSIKSTNLNSTTSSDEINDKEQPIETTTICALSRTRSLSRKSYTSYKSPNINSHLLLTDERTSLQNIPSLISTVLKNHYASQICDEPSTIFHPTSDELNTLQKLSQAINETIENELDTNIPLTIGIQDSIPISAKQLEISERRKQRYKRQREIISIAKRALKPAFKQREITKEEYKKIMKKVVTKATYSNKTDQKWISRMIDAYVNKYRSV